MSDPLDVSGSWDGVFNYPRGLPPSGFRAELRDHAGAITGETSERSATGPNRGQVITALLDGRRDGATIRFAKSYDTIDRAHYRVTYDGTISPDGDEIDGRWDIPGEWSGTFLMVRQTRRATQEARKIAEPVSR